MTSSSCTMLSATPALRNLDMTSLIGKLIYILDDNGMPILCDDVIAWATWIDSADRAVAVTTIAREGVEETIRVSTQFIGFDYGFGQSTRPVLYETMVFGGNLNHHTERTDDWYLALRRHYATVETVVALENAYFRREERQAARMAELESTLGDGIRRRMAEPRACPKCGGTRAHRATCEDEGFG